MDQKAISNTIKASLIVLLLFETWKSFYPPRFHQGDFKLYFPCEQILARGGNPYDASSRMPCLYSPIVLKTLGAPLLRFSPTTAQYLWVFLKLLVVVGLIFLWKRYFFNLSLGVFELIFFALAYGNPFLIDIGAGNISGFEQFFLWSGFAFLLADRPFLFGLCVALAAQAKLTPLLFLSLLLIWKKPRWSAFLGSLAFFAALFGLNFIFYPHLMDSFFKTLRAGQGSWWYEVGGINPSSFAFFVQLSQLEWPGNLARAATFATILTSGFIGILGGLSLWTYIKKIRPYWASDPAMPLKVIFWFCALYALSMPRFKNYSYILMLVPTLYIVKSISLAWQVPILICCFLDRRAVLHGVPAAFFLAYFNLYAVLLVWAAYTVYFKRNGNL